MEQRHIQVAYKCNYSSSYTVVMYQIMVSDYDIKIMVSTCEAT